MKTNISLFLHLQKKRDVCYNTRCCANYVAHPQQVGNLDVSVQFETAPTGTLQMLTYSVFRAEIRVDAERNVAFDSP